MEHKTFPGIVTKVDAAQGIVEQVVAVFGNLDLGGDVIHPGAFVKTIAERGLRVRCLDNHQTDSIMRVLGKTLALREIGREELPADLLAKTPSASGGLWVRTQYLLDTPEGKGAFVRIKEGAIDEYSIGYDALDVDYSKLLSEGKQVTARNLRTLKLYEYSPVLWGMNTATATVSAKGEVPAEGKPYPNEHACRLKDPDAFDGASFRRSTRKHEGKEYAVIMGKLKGEDTMTEQAYRYPKDTWDAGAAKAHCDAHEGASFEAASGEKEMTPGGPMRRMGDSLVGAMCQMCDGMCNGWLSQGMISEDEHQTMRRAADQAMQMMRMAMPPEMAERDASPRGGDMMWLSGDGPDERKVGRVLSASNATRLQNALTEINDVLKAAGLLEAGDAEKDSDKQDGKSAPTGADDSQQAAKAGPVQPPTSNSRTLALLDLELEELTLLEV